MIFTTIVGLNTEVKNMPVSEYFSIEGIDLDFIERKFDGKYWESAVTFLESVWNDMLESLSDQQYKWVVKILEDCVERRIEGGH